MNEDIYRTKSGADLAEVLLDPAKSLICSLVHKFGSSEEGSVDRYVSDLRSHMSDGAETPGEFFVFVDECHRTQSGKLHRAMKAIPSATLIGFTGTPLLRADKLRSIETFGPYIHTYKLASGDYVDLKVFEPAMRHLLDTYIRAEDSRVVSAFDELVDLLVRDGAEAIGELPEGIRSSPAAVAETIENNVRHLIVDEMAVNPKYYEKMSAVLDARIKQRKEEAIDYKAYLRKVIELAAKVRDGEGGASYPENIRTRALRAIFDNLREEASAWRSAASRWKWSARTSSTFTWASIPRREGSGSPLLYISTTTRYGWR